MGKEFWSKGDLSGAIEIEEARFRKRPLQRRRKYTEIL